MDVQRSTGRKKGSRQRLHIGLAALGTLLLGWAAFSVTGRPPVVDRELVWSGEVKRGEFIYEVTAAGSLVAQEIRTITSRSDGVVERVRVLPGHAVRATDVLVELSSASLPDELMKARSALDAAEADARLQRARSEDEFQNLLVALAGNEADYQSALFESDAKQKLLQTNAVSQLDARNSAMKVELQKRRFEAAKSQVERYPHTRASQEAVLTVKTTQLRREVERLEQEISDLQIRAGFSGVVQSVDVELGRRIGAGTQVARVVNPENLIARVRVSERDASLVKEGQQVRLDLGRHVQNGRVARVEPTVQDRLVTVDVAIEAEGGDGLAGLRPEMTVTARIEIDRAPDTLLLDRPAGLTDDRPAMSLYRLDDAGNRAVQVNVQIGRISGRQIEIKSGLDAGDKVILADLTEWSDAAEIRIR